MGEPGDRRIRTVVRKFDKSLTVKAESLAGRFGAIEHSARQGAVEKQRVFGGRVGTEGRSGRHEFCKSVGLGAEVKFGGFQPISCTAVGTRCVMTTLSRAARQETRAVIEVIAAMV